MEELCKKDLMQLIRATNFAIIELAQYLDTHPEEECACKRYRDYCKKMKKAMDIYEKKYAPIMIYDAEKEEHWMWGEEPWPWQKECDC